MRYLFIIISLFISGRSISQIYLGDHYDPIYRDLKKQYGENASIDSNRLNNSWHITFKLTTKDRREFQYFFNEEELCDSIVAMFPNSRSGRQTVLEQERFRWLALDSNTYISRLRSMDNWETRNGEETLINRYPKLAFQIDDRGHLLATFSLLRLTRAEAKEYEKQWE